MHCTRQGGAAHANSDRGHTCPAPQLAAASPGGPVHDVFFIASLQGCSNVRCQGLVSVWMHHHARMCTAAHKVPPVCLDLLQTFDHPSIGAICRPSIQEAWACCRACKGPAACAWSHQLNCGVVMLASVSRHCTCCHVSRCLMAMGVSDSWMRTLESPEKQVSAGQARTPSHCDIYRLTPSAVCTTAPTRCR